MALSREFSKADGASPSALDLTAAFRDTGEAVSRVSENARIFDREAAFRAGEYRDSGDETVLAGYVGHSAAMAALTVNAEATKEEKKRAEDAAFEATIRALQEQIRVLEVQIDGLEEDIAKLDKKISKLDKEIEASEDLEFLLVNDQFDSQNEKHLRLLEDAGYSRDNIPSLDELRDDIITKGAEKAGTEVERVETKDKKVELENIRNQLKLKKTELESKFDAPKEESGVAVKGALDDTSSWPMASDHFERAVTLEQIEDLSNLIDENKVATKDSNLTKDKLSF